MKLTSILGIVLFTVGIMWLPIIGLVLFDWRTWWLAVLIVGVTLLGAYMVYASRREEEEMQALAEEEAEAMVNGLPKKDKDNDYFIY